MSKKSKIHKVGSRKRPAALKQINAMRKKIKKRLNPHERLMARFVELVPATKDVEGDAKQSWVMLAHKILLARRMKTSVFVITPNPLMLEHREVLQKEFPCAIQSPCEARFGMDSIEKF